MFASRLLVIIATGLLILASAGELRAGEANTSSLPEERPPSAEESGDGVSPIDLDYLEGFPTIAWQAVSTPFDVSDEGLILTGAALGGLGLALLLDDPFRDLLESESKGRTDAGFKGFSKIADRYTLGAALATGYIAGEATNDVSLQRASLLAVQSTVVSGLIAEGLKYLTGRARPSDTDKPLEWKGPGTETNTSFPSGHATAAFAAATVFAEEYDDTIYVPILAYSLATGVGAARMLANRHWFSDFVASAAIGYGVAQLAVRNSPFDPEDQTVQIAPLPVDHGTGLAVRIRF